MRLIIIFTLFLAQTFLASEATWQPLFNGKDFSDWDIEMMNPPDPAWDVPGMERGTNGVYLESLGKNRDPLRVFTVTNLDGGPVIHISGQGFGVIMTKTAYTNVHVRLEIKWGKRKWSKKLNKPFDTGMLYFCHSEAGVVDKTWPRSLEFQICENEFGDLYALGSQVSINARKDGTLWSYTPNGTNTLFLQKRPIGNHCAHSEDAENAKGEWNTIDLITFNGDSIHVVNGKVVMRLHQAGRLDQGAPQPITAGKISLQTEGGECYFRHVELKSIAEIPPQFAEH